MQTYIPQLELKRERPLLFIPVVSDKRVFSNHRLIPLLEKTIPNGRDAQIAHAQKHFELKLRLRIIERVLLRSLESLVEYRSVHRSRTLYLNFCLAD